MSGEGRRDGPSSYAEKRLMTAATRKASLQKRASSRRKPSPEPATSFLKPGCEEADSNYYAGQEEEEDADDHDDEGGASQLQDVHNAEEPLPGRLSQWTQQPPHPICRSCLQDPTDSHAATATTSAAPARGHAQTAWRLNRKKPTALWATAKATDANAK